MSYNCIPWLTNSEEQVEVQVFEGSFDQIRVIMHVTLQFHQQLMALQLKQI